MMLIPLNASSQILSSYNAFASIDEDGLPTEDPPTGNFASLFADGYHSYANDGIVPGAVSGGGDKSILEALLNSIYNDEFVIPDFAEALAIYWSGVAIAPGAPAHGGLSVVSVVNDAASRIPAFISAITASYTMVKTDPGFLHFIQNIETIAVNTIVWTVTEAMPGGGTQAFPEGIT